MSFVLRARTRAWTPRLLALAGSLAIAAAFAQSTTDPSPPAVASAAAPLTLGESFRAALAMQPWLAATDERAREQAAREAVAGSWLADAPTLASGIKASNRESAREYEVELSAPVATPARRNLLVATARGESAVFRSGIEQQKLKLAGEVRDVFWALQLALTEAALADDEVRRADTLSADTARRTAAGDLARVDSLQARALLRSAQAAQLEAAQRVQAARQALQSLTGTTAQAALADGVESRSVATAAALAAHPSLRQAETAADFARARRNEVSTLTNAAPTLSFALTNERSSSGSPASTARIGIAIPFGGSTRAAPRIAQAEAELTEAQAGMRQLQRQLAIEAQGAEQAAIAAERRVAALAERAALAQEVADLYARAYRLGELDLPTRLRTEGERAAAQLALSRARIELKHAQSRVNQSLGILP